MAYDTGRFIQTVVGGAARRLGQVIQFEADLMFPPPPPIGPGGPGSGSGGSGGVSTPPPPPPPPPNQVPNIYPAVQVLSKPGQLTPIYSCPYGGALVYGIQGGSLGWWCVKTLA